MNKRKDILAEVNMLKVLVWKMWENLYGSIDSVEWDELKKEVIKKMNNS